MILSGKTILTIDRLFLLPHRLAEFIFKTFGKIRNDHGRSILVIKFMGIGSIIRFAALCEEHNADKQTITLLTLAQNRELCELLGFRNSQYIRTQNFLLFFIDCWKIIYSIKSFHPSLLIDYERCAHSVGLYSTLLAWRCQCKIISFEPHMNISSLKQIIYPVDELNQEQLFLKGIERMPKSEKSYSHESVEVQPTKILVNINTSNYLLARRYSVNSFAKVIKSIHQWDNRLEFYLTGSRSEANYVETLITKLEGVPVHNCCGEWSLEELSNELSDCALFITGDSGPLHLAAYLEVPTLAIWGPTQPGHFGYQDKPHMHHVSMNLHCAPCFKHPASKPARVCQGQIDCLKNLAPLNVFEEAIQLLSHQAPSRLVHFPKEKKFTIHKIPNPQPAT